MSWSSLEVAAGGRGFPLSCGSRSRHGGSVWMIPMGGVGEVPWLGFRGGEFAFAWVGGFQFRLCNPFGFRGLARWRGRSQDSAASPWLCSS